MTENECRNLPNGTTVLYDQDYKDGCSSFGYVEKRDDDMYFIPAYYRGHKISQPDWKIRQFPCYRLMSNEEFVLWKLENV